MSGRGILAVAIAACSVATAGRQAPASIDSWPMFRGSSTHEGIATTQLPAMLRLRWSYQAKDSIESSAAIVDGAVYVGSMDGLLSAFELATGRVRWQYDAKGPIQESSPAVLNGTVFVGDVNGTLHAVDASTGKIRWTFKTDGEIRSSPMPVGDRVFVGSYDQNLYCLSAATGAVLWKFTTEDPVHGTPAIEKGVVYISGCDETFRAIDAGSGKQLYAVRLGAYTGASAAVRDQRAFVGTFGNEVLGIDLTRHTVRWTYRHPTRNFPFYSSAALTAHRVILGGRDKLVHALDGASGKSVWTFLTRARVESSPLVAGDRVFVGSNDGTLYELSLASGKKTWEFVAGAPLSASPAAAQGALVIGSQDGVLYCFGA